MNILLKMPKLKWHKKTKQIKNMEYEMHEVQSLYFAIENEPVFVNTYTKNDN